MSYPVTWPAIHNYHYVTYAEILSVWIFCRVFWEFLWYTVAALLIRFPLKEKLCGFPVSKYYTFLMKNIILFRKSSRILNQCIKVCMYTCFNKTN